MYMPTQVPYIYRRGTKKKILNSYQLLYLGSMFPMLCNRNRELKDKASSCLHETQLRKSDDLL